MTRTRTGAWAISMSNWPSRARPSSNTTVSAELDPLDSMTHVFRCLGLQDLAQFAAAEVRLRQGA